MASAGAKRPLAEQPSFLANAQLHEPPAKRRHKPTVPAALKLQPIKKLLNAHVKTLAHMVKTNRYDGYDEQAEEMARYFSNLRGPFQAVYDVGIVQNAAHGACHDVLMCIADTWEHMTSIPMRDCVWDCASDIDSGEVKIKLSKWGGDLTKTFDSDVCQSLGYMWRLLLQSAAGNSRCKDEVLFQYIKDATDYRIDPLDTSEPDDTEETLVITDVDAHAKAGFERLVQLHARKDEWKSLPSNFKVYKKKPAIDPRYDGPNSHYGPGSDSDSNW